MNDRLTDNKQYQPPREWQQWVDDLLNRATCDDSTEDMAKFMNGPAKRHE